MVTYHFEHIRNMHLSWFEANDFKTILLAVIIFGIATVVAIATNPKDSEKKDNVSHFATLVAIFCLGYAVVSTMGVVVGSLNQPSFIDNLNTVSNNFDSQFERYYPAYDKSSVDEVVFVGDKTDSRQTKSFILHNSKTNQDEACKLVFANDSKNFQQLMETDDKSLPEYFSGDVKAELVCSSGKTHIVTPVGQ